MTDSASISLSLPEELRRQFDQVERRLWRVETAVAVCCVGGGLLTSFLALFISDRLWDSPVWLRLLFFALGLAAAVAAGLNWARRWVWQRRDLRAMANLVQKKYRRLGDRLLGIVELANEQRHLSNFSPALYHAAIHQVAEEAKKYDFQESVSSTSAKKFAAVAGGLLGCLLLASLVLPEASWNSFRRWIAPMASIDRYTLVAIEGLPSELIVAHGEPFAISGAVRYRSFWKPGRVAGQIQRQPGLEGTVQSGSIRMEIPGQVENGILEVRVGDARARVKVLPNYRPSMQELTAQIQLPDYLHYPDETEVVHSGSFLALDGSRVAFQGKVSQPLASALMQQGDSTSPLKIQGQQFNSDAASLAGVSQFTFNWRDTLGLSNAAPLRLAVQTQADAPPVADLPDLPRDSAVLESDVMRIRVQARDDYGVRDLGLTWEAISDAPVTTSLTTELKTIAASPHEKKVDKVFKWSPALLRIPADTTVELEGYARDYFPERERSRTSAYRIRVLSAQEHAELLRQQLEAVMAQVEEVTRLQEKIAADTKALKENDALPEAQKTSRIGQSKEDQLQNAAHLDEAAKQAEHSLQEAMKNPIFTEDAIRKWAQTLENWQKLSQQKMKAAANSMQSAQQNSKSRPQDLAEAAQKAEDILKELQKSQSKASEHLDQLQALTLAERLRKVGAQEKDIGARLSTNAPDLVGLLPQELSEKFKRFDSDVAKEQVNQRTQSEALQAEISRFFERTQKQIYGQVSKEMKDARTGDELERLGDNITKNIVMATTSELDNWSDRFQKWSDQLQPKPESSSSASASGSGKSKSVDLTKQLIALLRVRDQQLTLRDQTSLLDEQKGDAANYKDRAGSLSQTQQSLNDEMAHIHLDTPLPSLDQSFYDTEAAMKEVQAFLQKPQTDKVTDTAEVKTVDALSDLINLINEQAQRPNPQSSPSSSSSAEEMAFMLKMMQNSSEAKPVPMNPSGGGNRSGGRTDRAGNPVAGNTQGKGASARDVSKASGVIENAPTEFREALDNYFHGVEQSKQ